MDARSAGGRGTRRLIPMTDRPPSTRPVLDGAAFGLYEDETPPSRALAIIGAVLAVAVIAVGILVWRAVNTEAGLDQPIAGASQATTAPSTTSPAPTLEALTALVPRSITTCVPPPRQPDDEPRIGLLCPLDGVPGLVSFVLHDSVEAADQAFNDTIAEFGLDADPVAADDRTECALGQPGVHDYIGVDQVGRVACRPNGGVVDFVWTSDEGPILARSSGGGTFADHYQFWERLVDRRDAAFPLGPEQALLDVLPDSVETRCTRDLGLTIDVQGVAAVRCEPADVAPTVMSSVQFAARPAMNQWIEQRRDGLVDNVVDQTDDGCTSAGFGRLDGVAAPLPSTPAAGSDEEPPPPVLEEPPPPSPDAGFMGYDLDGTTGRLLCFVNSNGLNAIFWTRDGSLVASIAVSDRETGATMTELLAWWETGGHLP